MATYLEKVQLGWHTLHFGADYEEFCGALYQKEGLDNPGWKQTRREQSSISLQKTAVVFARKISAVFLLAEIIQGVLWKENKRPQSSICISSKSQYRKTSCQQHRGDRLQLSGLPEASFAGRLPTHTYHCCCQANTK